MPDGSLIVIQEPDRVRNSFVGSEVDIVDIKQGGTAEAALLSQEWTEALLYCKKKGD